MPDRKVLISIVILLAIGLHAVPILWARERDTLWPFLHWAMYKESRPAGDIKVHKRKVMAISAGGEEATITPDYLGVSSFVLARRYVRPWWLGDTVAADSLLERLNTRRQDRFVELRMEVESYVLTDSALVRTPDSTLVYRAP
jgi:hypothetical protein